MLEEDLNSLLLIISKLKIKDMSRCNYEQISWKIWFIINTNIINFFFHFLNELFFEQLPLPTFEVGKDYPENNVYGLKGGDAKTWQHWTPFTYFFNLTRQPAPSVPIGLIKENLPVGLQVVDRLFDDDLVLNASHKIQKNATEMKFPFSE